MQQKSELQNVFDVSTNETLDFILQYLPNKTSRILEISCENGELAILQNMGFQVVAVDNSAEPIEKTKRLGLNARLAKFPSFE